MTQTRKAAITILAAACCFGCQQADRVEITTTLQQSKYSPSTRLDVPDSERFRLAASLMPAPTMPTSMPGGRPAAASPGAASGLNLAYSVPSGWKELPATQFRNPNFVADADDSVECYVSVLPGLGGGILQNANRWRKQMGQSPLSQVQVDQLSRRSVLGVESPYMVVEGEFAGMGGAAPKAGYKLIGVLAAYNGFGVYIKMVGPASTVDEQASALDTFLASLSVGDGNSPAPRVASNPPMTNGGGSLPAGHPPVGGTASTGTLPDGMASGQGLRWRVPDGWRDAGEKQMRLVTYTMGEGDETECYVTLLSGPAGGLANNVNRWLAQIGNAPVTEDAIQAMPTISFLGQSATLVEAQGAFAGMGGVAKPNYALLGIAWIGDDRSAFIKMTGPVETVAAQKAAFVEFCESFRPDV